MKNKRVLMAMSGGIDSSVSALLLREQDIQLAHPSAYQLGGLRTEIKDDDFFHNRNSKSKYKNKKNP